MNELKMGIRITNHKDILISLNGDEIKTLDYTPSVSNDETVSDEVEVMVIANIQANVKEISRAISVLNDYNENRCSEPLYLQFRTNDDKFWYESKIKAMSFTMSPNIFKFEYLNDVAVMTIEVERDSSWVADDWQILYNGKVSNYRENTHKNYIDFSKDDIDGDLPADVKIWIREYNTSTNVFFNKVYVGLSTDGVKPWLEAEDFSHDIPSGDYTMQLSNWPHYSGGLGIRYYFTIDNTNAISNIDLSTDDLNKARGKKFKVLVGYESNKSDGSTKIRMFCNPKEHSSYENYYLTDYMIQNVDSNVTAMNYIDMGTIRLPLTSRASEENVVWQFGLDIFNKYKSEGNTNYQNVDYVCFIPADKLIFADFYKGDEVPHRPDVVIDTTRGTATLENHYSGDEGVIHEVSYFGDMKLFPGKDQSLVVMTIVDHPQVRLIPHAENYIKVWYKPRKRVVL